MFSFSQNLLVGDSVNNTDEIIRLLNQGVSVFDTFLICTRADGYGLMELFHSPEIFKKVHWSKEYIIIGVANTRKESLDLLAKIVFEYIEAGGHLDCFKTEYKARLLLD